MSRVALVVLLLLAACTPPPPPEATPAPAAPDAAPAPAAPAAPDAPAVPPVVTGEYTVTIAAADLPAAMPDSLKQQITGAWVLALHDGGHAVVTQNGREVVQAPYVVSGSQFTLTADDTGPYACKSEGRYTWQMNNDQLTLTRVQDTCDGRMVVLTTRPLMRRG